MNEQVLRQWVEEARRSNVEILQRLTRVETKVEGIDGKLTAAAGLEGRIAALEAEQESEEKAVNRRNLRFGALMGFVGGVVGAVISHWRHG